MTATFPLREFSICSRESVTKPSNATSVHEAGELEEMIWSISEQPQQASDGGAKVDGSFQITIVTITLITITLVTIAIVTLQ